MRTEHPADFVRPRVRRTSVGGGRSSAAVVRSGLPLGTMANIVILAAIAYAPLLWSQAGNVSLDTASGLYLSPSRALRLAASRWDPYSGLGSIADRTYNPAFPMAQWYWIMDRVGVPDWIAQRLWLGTLLFVAGLGVARLLRTLGWRTRTWVCGAVAYAVTPYLLDSLGSHSVALLAWAALPWMTAETVLLMRTSGAGPAARLGLIFTVSASGHLPSTLYALVGPLLWVVYSTLATRETTPMVALRGVARAGAFGLGSSAWLVMTFAVDPGRLLDDLRATFARNPSGIRALDAVRSFAGAAGSDQGAAHMLQTRPAVTILSYLPVAVALIALAKVRFRYRFYAVSLLVVGLVLAGGAAPVSRPQPYARAITGLIGTRLGSLLQPTERALPLVGLAIALGVTAAAHELGRSRRSRDVFVVAGAVAITLAAVPPFVMGRSLDGPLMHAVEVPAPWRQLADQLAGTSAGGNVLELPALDSSLFETEATATAAGTAFLKRPIALRSPKGPRAPATFDLVAAIDDALRAGTLRPSAIVPLARLMAVDTIVVRHGNGSDAADAARVEELLSRAPGLWRIASASDPNPVSLSAFGVVEPLPPVRLVRPADVVVVSGSGRGLIDLANAGLIDGDELVLYSASIPDSSWYTSRLDPGVRFIVTDTNRRDLRDRTLLEGSLSPTLAPDTALGGPPGAERLSPVGAPANAFTVADYAGIASLSEHANGLTAERFNPAGRAGQAFDGDPGTSWQFAIGADGRSPRLTVSLAEPVETDHLTIDIAETPAVLRKVSLVFDGFTATQAPIPANAAGGTATISFPRRRFTTFTIRIDAIDGHEASPSGLAAISEIGIPGVSARERLTMPGDLGSLTGSTRHPLDVVITRWTDPASGADPEATIQRSWALWGSRAMSIRGRAHPLDGEASPPDGCRDDVLSVNGTGIGLRFATDPEGGWAVQECRIETFATGAFEVTTAPATTTGILVDQLVFHADASSRLVEDDRPPPPLDDLRRTDAGFRAGVDNAQGVYWLVQAASADPGWAASISSSAVGDPILVNGFGSAWYVEVPDDRMQTISIHMAAQGKINVAVLLSAAMMLVVAGVAIVATRRGDAEVHVRPPEPLRFLHTTVVALIALGIFSIGAGPVPGLVAGAAALVLDTKLGWRRWITWLPGAVVLAVAVAAALDRTRPLDGWADVAIWSAVALSATAALVDSERRPPPSPVLL